METQNADNSRSLAMQDKLWYIQKVEPFTDIKKKKKNTETYNTEESSKLYEQKEKQKDTYCISPYL